MANILAHTIKRMYSSWVCIDFQLISPSLGHIIAILIVKLNSIETDVEKVAMSGIKVELEQKADRHGDGLILLEEVHLVCLAVQAASNWANLLISPALHVR